MAELASDTDPEQLQEAAQQIQGAVPNGGEFARDKGEHAPRARAVPRAAGGDGCRSRDDGAGPRAGRFGAARGRAAAGSRSGSSAGTERRSKRCVRIDGGLGRQYAAGRRAACSRRPRGGRRSGEARSSRRRTRAAVPDCGGAPSNARQCHSGGASADVARPLGRSGSSRAACPNARPVAVAGRHVGHVRRAGE